MKVHLSDEAYPVHAFVASHEMIQLRVNGAEQSFSGEPEMPLLWYLRDILGLTGSKFGCGVGLCGACTVHVNGQATRSCVTAVRDVTGKEVTTVERLEKNGWHPVQKAWMHINVPQCGYCQAGQIMQAVALLNSKKNPSDQEIDEAMSGNICRCGTYQRIRAAIKAAAGEMA
jgi:isoquinoline 1-oxidoreductase alpha subunit